MPLMPAEVFAILMPFASLFTAPTFRSLAFLFVGAILTPGSRTVTACLRAVGLSHYPHFQNWHRTLNRAKWSPRQGARVLLTLLVQALVPSGPWLLGLDDTIERRRGEHIQAKGIYRDPVRSSHGHLVKCSGLRWLCLMLLAPIPFAKRVWTLPFFTALCPSQRYFEQHRSPRAPKTLIDWARQMLLQVRRWFPQRALFMVADSSFAVGELLWSWSRSRQGGPGEGYAPIHTITRLRLDAALFEPAPKRRPHQTGRPRKKGKRLPTPQQVLENPKTLWQCVEVAGWYASHSRKKARRSAPGSQGRAQKVELATGTAIWTNRGRPPLPIRWVLVRDPQGIFPPQALLCTDLGLEPVLIVSYFVQRWQMEVTFREVRAHLGVETQRQWNSLAIERTTPMLLALFSLITVLAQRLVARAAPGAMARRSAWYEKTTPTFADALAWVRGELWLSPLRLRSLHTPHIIPPLRTFGTSTWKEDIPKPYHTLFERMLDLIIYAP